jgi:uncharacterized membrane protein YkvI
MKNFGGHIGAKLDICAILFAVLGICSALIAHHFLLGHPSHKDVLPHFVERCFAYSIVISSLFILINVIIILHNASTLSFSNV